MATTKRSDDNRRTAVNGRPPGSSSRLRKYPVNPGEAAQYKRGELVKLKVFSMRDGQHNWIVEGRVLANYLAKQGSLIIGKLNGKITHHIPWRYFAHGVVFAFDKNGVVIYDE